MNYVRPKKKLGQHFLTDHNIARKIAESVDSSSCRNILELGPGTGILTTYFAEAGDSKLKLIEVDGESVEHLEEKFPEMKGDIYHEDFLKSDIKKIWKEKDFILAGNFPYNISSQIFFRVLEMKESIPQVVCMIQKEVAERIVAGPGSKTYGILSVLLQTWYDIEMLFYVAPSVFNPPPKVQSAVIRLKRNKRKDLGCSEKLFIRIVKAVFNQRRKMLRNSLKNIYLPKGCSEELLSRRPEQMSLDDFLGLCNQIEKELDGESVKEQKQ